MVVKQKTAIGELVVARRSSRRFLQTINASGYIDEVLQIEKCSLDDWTGARVTGIYKLLRSCN